MTNTKLLRQKIDESGYKLSFIADRLGLSYGGLQNKLEGKMERGYPGVSLIYKSIERVSA